MKKSKKDRTERRRVGLLFDEKMCKHKQAGGEHIENPHRIRAIWENLNISGLLLRCVVLNGKEANDDQLALVHSKEHINLIKTISSKNKKTMRKYANKYNSIYFNEGSSEAAYLAAGFVVEAAVKVAKGELNSAFAIVRPPGHHAEEAKPMGFCLLNNVAIATSVILNERAELGIKKILIVDWDVHHGNSTQKMFYKDPRVLVFSVHRHDSGRFYPEGSDGSYKMMGEGPGAGYNINVPWEGGGVGDLDYFAVWDHILLPVAKEFVPDLIMISAGFDAAIGDPIGGCCLSSYGYSVMLYELMGFARGKIVMALEGGYNPVSLADATEACIEMLLDYKPSVRSLEDHPLNSTWPLIKKVRQALCIYWPILAVKIPDKVINSRLHIEVDVDIRQDEVYVRTPTELEHASVSGRDDCFEGQRILKWSHPDVSEKNLYTLSVNAKDRDIHHLSKEHCRKLARLTTSLHHLEARAEIPEDQQVTVVVPSVPQAYYLLADRVREMTSQGGSRKKMDPPTALIKLRQGTKGQNAPAVRSPRAPARPSAQPSSSPQPKETGRGSKRRLTKDGAPIPRDNDRTKRSKGPTESSRRESAPAPSKSTSLEVVNEQEVVASMVASRGRSSSPDNSYLGYDPTRLREYKPEDHPGRAKVIHQLSCVKSAPPYHEIPDSHVRRATENIPRSWTKLAESITGGQCLSDNARLLNYNASQQAVLAQRILDQTVDLERTNRSLSRKLERFEEEKAADLTKKDAELANERGEHAKGRADWEQKMKATLDNEQLALQNSERMMVELTKADATVKQLETERAALLAQVEGLKAQTANLEEEKEDMVAYNTYAQDVADNTNFGYICAFAECMRSVKFATDNGKDVFESVKKDFIEYVKDNPPASGSTLFVADLESMGMPMDVFGPDVEIVAPTFGSGEASRTDEVFDDLISLPLTPLDQPTTDEADTSTAPASDQQPSEAATTVHMPPPAPQV